jgi:hypothetical protein
MYTNFPYTEVQASYDASTECVEGVMPSGYSVVAIIAITINGTEYHIDTHLSQQLSDANNEDWLMGLIVEQVRNVNGPTGLKAEDFDAGTYGQTHLNFPKAYLPAGIAGSITTAATCSMKIAVFQATPFA